MKIAAFVPIKMNSERLTGKNIKAFTNGKPLIGYILETLSKIEEIDASYVYCSDERIQDYIHTNAKFIKRNPYYDLSSTAFNEVLASFAEIIEADIYVLAHATAPFIKEESIRTGIKRVASGNYDSALAVSRMQEFLWKDGKPFNYNVNSIPRTQDLESLYIETCGLYIYTRDLIQKQKKRIGQNPYLIEVSKIEAIDINEQIDFDIADAVYNAKYAIAR